ncbi:helix-turn-helix domain-containing protein [Neobacillus sp. WH10]|uniref:PucR family transcriptional regulator n=1 Tax=Neobacillus sp. WH10 TaxID=3047873 RepID=UPI0024C12A80|nr:helix-turn-helix domain-containing protein [Neobacillus sp. WH10]WHY78879.1 helix-turn-helix domain-containing protein [Neobacillus sp. WH10]
MLRKLLSIYENSILFPSQPDKPSEQFYYFYSEAEDEWIGIPKTEMSEKELNLLKALYKTGEFQVSRVTTAEKAWYDFLFLHAPAPHSHSETFIRFIQFNINGNDANQVEIESALKGFFTEDVIIIWESGSRGIVVEEKKQISLSEEELISMSETLESDFYVTISFFIGKLNLNSEQLRSKFLLEKEYFSFAITKLGSPTIFTFERVFPAYLAHYLPEELKHRGSQEIAEVFHDDPEMFSTIKVFLENNLNASLTAKKLYIHRNTLQYRIDKFTEKTGIGLKDFYGAFTVFLACLLFEQNQVK